MRKHALKPAIILARGCALICTHYYGVAALCLSFRLMVQWAPDNSKLEVDHSWIKLDKQIANALPMESHECVPTETVKHVRGKKAYCEFVLLLLRQPLQEPKGHSLALVNRLIVSFAVAAKHIPASFCMARSCQLHGGARRMVGGAHVQRT